MDSSRLSEGDVPAFKEKHKILGCTVIRSYWLTGKDRTPGSSSGAPSSPPGGCQAGDHCLLIEDKDFGKIRNN